MTTTAVDLPEDTALVVTVIVTEAHLAGATMTMTVDVMAVLLQELVPRLMTTLLLAAVASMIRIVATTHPLTPTSMAMADLPTTVLHQETTHPEMLVTLMITAAVTSNSSFQAGDPVVPTHMKDRSHFRNGNDTFSHESEGTEAFCNGHSRKAPQFHSLSDRLCG